MQTIISNSYSVFEVGAGLSRSRSSIDRLGPTEVLVRMKAVSLNFRDLLVIDDVGPKTTGDQTVPVSDGAGIIEAVGVKVTTFKPGERVAPSFFTDWVDGPYRPEYRKSALGGAHPGLLSEFVILPESCLVRIPDVFSFEEAACFPCAGVTAWNALSVGRLKADETVLIQGTGGVSLFALQITKFMRAKAIVISRSREKLEKASQLGADYCLDTTSDWPTAVLEITKGQGVNHVVEVVGNRNLVNSVTSLAPYGQIAFVGCLGGYDGGFDPLSLLYKQASLNGVYVGSRSDLVLVMEQFASAGLSPVIDKAFRFEDALAAFDYIRTGKQFGKVVISF